MSTDYIKNIQSIPYEVPHIDQPPHGIRMEQTYDGTAIITVRMFSGWAFIVLFSALFWNGLLSVFVAALVVNTAANVGYPIQYPFSFIQQGTGSSSPLWLEWIIFTPFIIAGMGLIYWTLFSFFGKCEIRYRAGEGNYYRGFTPFGRKQHFTPKIITSLGRRVVARDDDGDPIWRFCVTMDNGREIMFPRLDPTQEDWLAFALEKILGLPSREASNPQHHHA